MNLLPAVLLTAALLLPDRCAPPPGDRPDSGVDGRVHLGPQCPVEVAGEPCPDEPAVGVEVTVHEQLPGEAYGGGAVVARVTTDDEGAFRVALPPGDFVVTAEAGMSCEFMDVTVAAGEYSTVDVPCDTGIR